ncbi:VOC family protein [Kribbella sandramycini]|uniref:Putative enzyme related to lactoylglutathione lyase n=1 Tax=Kribbella sandramycini TaxID=60450 RepID=A0A7Y4P117_9ACTN|nr:VOC family protein [Kribbella sandramycini]MBB6565375.1 putative enzyme related to lactoylglutathione lyase [Kribbella sandramycini]NOL41644.1 VOC family protein [Kribbella sandramycini]
MTSRVRTVTFDTHDPYELAGFWLQVLRAPRPDYDHPGDPAAEVVTDGMTLLFEQNDDVKTVKNRVHLCLEPDGPRDAEVEWLQTLGATVANDLRNPDGTGWVVMLDPEGNEFCVLRSAAERAATS